MFKNLSELDVIFISYDEANCEENWADLLTKAPWAKRVHGVEGSDAAHKAAAKLSDTDRFISVDGDNKVDSAFFDLALDFNSEKYNGKVISWSAKNDLNGLVYGNGGLKIWPKEYALNLKSHENAPVGASKMEQIEFCWADRYTQMANQYSNTYPCGNARQAFRAGFREGVKMSLDRGERVLPSEFKERIYTGNYKRLLTWCTVGADVKNGLWSIYGARIGAHMTALDPDWDYVNVRDFKYINRLYEDKSLWLITDELLKSEIGIIGKQLVQSLGLEIADLDAAQSIFFKASSATLPRLQVMLTEDELNKLRRINS